MFDELKKLRDAIAASNWLGAVDIICDIIKEAIAAFSPPGKMFGSVLGITAHEGKDPLALMAEIESCAHDHRAKGLGAGALFEQILPMLLVLLQKCLLGS